MKQSTNITDAGARALRVHKIWAAVALVGLFVCGLMVGLSWHGKSQPVASGDATVQFTESQCDMIADKIQSAVKYSRLEELTQLKKIYAESCGNHIAAKTEVVSDSAQKLSTCEKIEKLLLRNLNASDSQVPRDHTENAELYNKLSQHGCPENADAYKQLVAQETAIANALGAPSQEISNTMRTCEEIEMVLKNQIYEYPADTYGRMHNAEVYSTMAERGCPENAEKYKELALRQIDVVSAVSSDDELEQNKDAIVDTYNKLQMQDAARTFLKKMDRLVEPATDLIYEIGKVFNE